MADSDLLVLAPWVVFAGGVVTLMVLAITRERRRSRLIRARRGRRKDQKARMASANRSPRH